MPNTDDLIREATRNGEDYLQTQIQIALAADQRAVSLGGILAASASVVLGFLFSDVGKLAETAAFIFLFFVSWNWCRSWTRILRSTPGVHEKHWQ